MNGNATAPARQRKPRQKPARFVRLCIKPEGTSTGVIRLAVGKVSADYFVSLIDTDYGRGFMVEKVGIDATEGKYHVNIASDQRTCDCKGHLRHGLCKHADGIAALIAAGKL